MIDALLISNGVLWLLVIGLALTVLALTRQIGLLHERISPVGALSPQAKIKVGDPAPELALIDLHDRPLQKVPRVRVVLASDGLPDEHRVFVDEKRISHLPYVLSAPLGMAYGVAKLPYAVLIDEGGIVAAQGLVNTREHLESLFEAQRRGIASIQDYLEEKAK
ncbi:MAG: hypothetical protein JRF48_09825 [Deltaproteobacteria bacterium]|nr:hypothetical protein [Deltaproteobacteria bacterium]